MKKKLLLALSLCAVLSLFGCGEEECVHQNCDEIIIAVPTCTEDGLVGYTCRDCRFAWSQKMPATGHTVVEDPRVEPTETEEGKTAGSHCEVCGIVLVPQSVIPPRTDPFELPRTEMN